MSIYPKVLKPVAICVGVVCLMISGVSRAAEPAEPVTMYLPTQLYHYINADGVGNPASAFQLAKLRFSQGDETAGEFWLQKSADAGHPEACLEKAKRTEGPSAKAYLTVALQHRLPEAKRYLSSLYEKGQKGFSRDYKQAFALLFELAEQGDSEAMHSVAYYFMRGLHGVKDEVAAAHWYHQGARAGNQESFEAYAWMAENGVGTQKDLEEAAWYRKQIAR